MALRHTSLSVFTVSITLGSALASWLSGCTTPGREFASGAESTSSGNGGGSGSGGSGGQGGEGPVGCDPKASPSEDACVIDNDFGIFVASKGNDVNPGTKVAPVLTLARAIVLAVQSQKRIYACAEAFNEAIVVPAGVEIYGGLD